MALSVVQAQHAVATTTNAVTVSISPAAGNLLVAMVGQNVNNTTAAVMSATGATPTWAQTVSGYSSSVSSQRAGMFYAMNIPSGITAVTVTWGSISGRVNVCVFEISGAALTSAEDSSVNSAATAVTSLLSGSLTTTNANDILLYGMNFSAAVTADTAGTGYTFPTNGDAATGAVRIDMDFKIVFATQSGTSTTTTWTTSASVSSVFAAFKAAAGGAATVVGWPSKTAGPSWAI